MKLCRIIAICFLVLMLSGCAMLGLLSDMAEESGASLSSESEDDGSKLLTSESSGASERADASESVRSEPKDPPAVSTEPGPETPALSPAIEGILAEAPEGCILAVVRMLDKPRFATLGEPVLTMDMSEYYPGQICETVMLVPLADGIGIDVELFELHMSLYPWRISNEVLYQLDGNIGEIYALHTFLAEGFPTMSVTASIGGRESEWVCMMDGSGEVEIGYLPPPGPPEEETFLSAPYIEPLSRAAACCQMVYGDDHFWETVAYGIALTETPAAYTETDSGKKITLSRDRFESYVETLFPGLTAWPPWEGSRVETEFSYHEADDTYVISHFYISEIESWQLEPAAEDADGKGGTMIVMVRESGHTVIEKAYEVVWREKQLRGDNDPIAFEIVEIRETEGHGFG